MRHGEKGDRTGPIQAGTLLVNGNWNLCQGHGKGQWPNLFSCSQQSTSSAPEEGRERLRSYGQCPNTMKGSLSSTKALCRKPCLSCSYERDKPSDLLAAIPINPSEAASCPHHCLNICYWYPAMFVLLPSPAPLVYGQDGLVGLTHTWEIQGAGIKSRSGRSKSLNTNFAVRIHYWFRLQYWHSSSRQHLRLSLRWDCCFPRIFSHMKESKFIIILGPYPPWNA